MKTRIRNLLLSVAALVTGWCLSPAAGAQTGYTQGRVLAIDVTQAASGDFEEAFSAARAAGMNATSLTIFWDEIEQRPGVFQPDVNWLAIANQYYASIGMPVSLTISVIDTVTKRVPADLARRPLDDRAVKRRFRKFLNYVFSQIPALELSYIAIGNEVDAWIGDNRQRRRSYKRFFKSAAKHARKRRPGAEVGVKITFHGLTEGARAYSRSLNRFADVVLLTYYPLDARFRALRPGVVGAAFDQVAALYAGRRIYFAELGYPSSQQCGSSETRQARFIRKAFDAWDKHADQIGLINFTWLTDISPAAVDRFEDYYGVGSQCFGEYLGTLGLRRADGTPKPAYRALRREARQRRQ